MSKILVFYGSYRSDRMGIRLAQYVIDRLRRRDDDVELIDAKAVGLPMLDRLRESVNGGRVLSVTCCTCTTPRTW